MGAGLDIGSYSLKLCDATGGWGSLRLRAHAEVPVPPGVLRPSAVEENVADPGAFQQLVATLAGQLGRRPRRVRVGISDLAVRVRILSYEALPEDRAEAQKYILWRLGSELDFPPEEARVDYTPLPPAPWAPGTRLLCVVANTRVVGQYEQLLTQAGLAVSGIAPSSALLFNLFEGFFLPRTRRMETPLLVNIGHTCSTLVLAWNGAPAFWRSLPSGAAEFILADKDAEERRSGAKRLLQDLLDSITFCAEECGLERPDRLVLAGGLAGVHRLSHLLGQKLGIPVEVLDPQAALAGGDANPESTFLGWGAALAAAVQN